MDPIKPRDRVQYRASGAKGTVKERLQRDLRATLIKVKFDLEPRSNHNWFPESLFDKIEEETKRKFTIYGTKTFTKKFEVEAYTYEEAEKYAEELTNELNEFFPDLESFCEWNIEEKQI